MSEKKLLIGSILTLLILSTILFGLMLKKDEVQKRKAVERFENEKLEVEMSWPKVEIETRK